MRKEEDEILIWNLKIPITPELKNHISNELHTAVREVLNEPDQILKAIRIGIFKHKDAYKNLFRDIIIEIMDEMELKVNFNV